MNESANWNKQTYSVPIAGIGDLEGFLNIPVSAKGVVLFAHGSGSSRHSPRNQFVAHTLHRDHIATMLIDLFTANEEKYDQRTGQLRFDIDLLGKRVAQVTQWLTQHPETAQAPIGYFGASTGAAAALCAATEYPQIVKAIVSRGGRPDLAGAYLDRVQAPTLLIVGGLDTEVIALNRGAYAKLHCPKQLEIVPGATHLFEEPGTLEQVAQRAGEWFHQHLTT